MALRPSPPCTFCAFPGPSDGAHAVGKDAEYTFWHVYNIEDLQWRSVRFHNDQALCRPHPNDPYYCQTCDGLRIKWFEETYGAKAP